MSPVIPGAALRPSSGAAGRAGAPRVLAVAFGVWLVYAGPAAPAEAAPAGDPRESSLILISLDGFRWDYLELAEPPNLLRLAAAGVRAEGLVPVFPAKTFPSHYSIVTGLYPGRHGILFNRMYDPGMDAVFDLGDRQAVEDPRWWGGEPIWVTAEKQGVRTAAMFWPGTEAEIAGLRPSYWHRFDAGFAYEKRVTQVLAWLDLPAGERPRFITLYFQDPNDTSHDHGPEAPETLAAVREVDARLGDLLRGLDERGLAGRVDLVVVSDHGMAAVAPERVVFVDEIVDFEPGEVFDQGALLQLRPRPGRERLLYEALEGAHPRLAVYRPDEVPEGYRLEAHRRLPPILGVPDLGWQIYTRRGFARYRSPLRGDHGQAPEDPRMHGLLVAAGPSFRPGQVIGRVESVELYNLMAAVLGVEPAPNDGDPARLRHLLAR